MLRFPTNPFITWCFSVLIKFIYFIIWCLLIYLLYFLASTPEFTNFYFSESNIASNLESLTSVQGESSSINSNQKPCTSSNIVDNTMPDLSSTDSSSRKNFCDKNVVALAFFIVLVTTACIMLPLFYGGSMVPFFPPKPSDD